MRLALKIALPIVTVLAGAAITVVLASQRKPLRTKPLARPAPVVRTIDVEPTSHRFTVRSQGTVEPRTQSALVTQVGGEIVWAAPVWSNGGFFAAGDALLRVDARDYELARTRAASELAQAELRLATEEAEAEIARAEWESLGKAGALTTTEPSSLVLREPQLAQARATVAAAKAALDKAALDLSRTEIRAPFDGRIRETRVDRGQYVSPGTPVATVYSTDYAEVRLPIPDTDLPFLSLPLARPLTATEGYHERVDVTLTADFAGAIRGPWQGEIVRTEGEIDPRSRMVHAIARVEDPYGTSTPRETPLAVGLFVEARLEGGSIDNAVTIPRHAIRRESRVLVVESFDSPARGLDAAVATVPVLSRAWGGVRRLRFRAIHIVRLEGENAILDVARSELVAGDRICVSPLEVAVDGMEIRLLEERDR